MADEKKISQNELDDEALEDVSGGTFSIEYNDENGVRQHIYLRDVGSYEEFYELEQKYGYADGDGTERTIGYVRWYMQRTGQMHPHDPRGG